MRSYSRFHKSLIISIMLHVLFAGSFMYGFPSLFEPLPQVEDVFTFEVVSISSITNIKTQTATQKKISPTVHSQQLTVKHKTQVKTESTVSNQSKTNITPSATPKQSKPKAPEKITPPKPKVKPPKDPEVKSDKTYNESLDSLLKNLESESDKHDGKDLKKDTSSEQTDNKSAKGDKYDDGLPLSTTEKALIKREITKHWHEPVTGKDISVFIKIQFAKNGSIKEVTHIKTKCPANSNRLCKLTEDSVMRAVWQTEKIHGLPMQRYSVWKEFNIEFTPSR